MTEPGPRDASFDDFLAQLTDAVGERIESLSVTLPSTPDPVFHNDAKIIYHWPDLIGLIIEDLR